MASKYNQTNLFNSKGKPRDFRKPGSANRPPTLTPVESRSRTKANPPKSPRGGFGNRPPSGQGELFGTKPNPKPSNQTKAPKPPAAATPKPAPRGRVSRVNGRLVPGPDPRGNRPAPAPKPLRPGPTTRGALSTSLPNSTRAGANLPRGAGNYLRGATQDVRPAQPKPTPKPSAATPKPPTAKPPAGSRQAEAWLRSRPPDAAAARATRGVVSGRVRQGAGLLGAGMLLGPIVVEGAKRATSQDFWNAKSKELQARYSKGNSTDQASPNRGRTDTASGRTGRGGTSADREIARREAAKAKDKKSGTRGPAVPSRLLQQAQQQNDQPQPTPQRSAASRSASTAPYSPPSPGTPPAARMATAAAPGARSGASASQGAGAQKWENFNPGRGTAFTNNPLIKNDPWLKSRMKEGQAAQNIESSSKVGSKFSLEDSKVTDGLKVSDANKAAGDSAQANFNKLTEEQKKRLRDRIAGN